MEWNEVADNWAEYSNKARSNWNKLSSDQLAELNGDQQSLSNLIQNVYQCTADEANNEIGLWLSNLLGANTNPNAAANLDQKLKANQDTAETIVERDEIVGSPFHKGY